jgi:PAS domain S-box-containing protein
VTKKRQRLSYILILIFIILTAGIVSAVYLYYQHYKENYRVVVERKLSAVAKLKVDELVHWRNERLGDAGIFYKNTAFSALVRRYFEKPDDTETQGQVRTWLSQVQTANEYDRVMLLDTSYSKKMMVPDGPELITSFVSQSESDILRSGKVVFGDFYWNEQNQRIYLKVLVPILDEANDNRVIAVLALRIDPEKYLYPFIKQWPTPSKTAETLLVRRQGNEALFLNELRFKKNTALNLRVPLDKNKELPAVKAALGQEGIVEGIDYQVPVIAFVCAVPDSPWFLVARMDTPEVYAPLKEKLWVTIVLVGILLTGASAGVGFIWKQQLAGFDQQKCEASKLLMGSEEKYRSLVEATPDWIWEVDREGVYTYVSPKVKDLLGYEVSEVLGKTPFDLMPEEEAARTRKIFMEKVVEREPFYRLENINHHKDGHLVVLESSGVPAFDDNGQFQGYQGTDRDITEYKQAEKALRESEERYKNLFKANIDGILIADAATKKFRYVNPAMCRMLGYSEEELTRMGVADIHPKESLEQVFAEFEALAAGTKITAKDLQCVRKDGQVISVSINAGKVMIDQTEYLLAIFRDITDRRQAEETLRQAKTQAEAANKAKTQFLANMSHEIRTPLNAIVGFSETLLQEELTEKQKEHLRTIYNSGKYLLCLISDILDISRTEAGEINIEMKQCSLGQLIAKIESMMYPPAVEKGLTFEIREKGDLPANIVTDAAHLQQCLINLVNNAIKFTEQGHVYVNISLEDKDSEPRIRFEVEDTGIGITPEFQQKMFDSFVQEDMGTSRKYGGMGLGLSIAKRFAGLLGGELTLTSEKGKGSAFSLVIPAGVDLAAQPLLNRQEIIDDIITDISKTKQGNFSGCVLVAEDVKSNQMLMKFLLDRVGLKVTIAENGAEAVNKALGQKFDLIFMDIQMPQVDGYEATRTLRSKGIKTPIVALTAGAMEGDDKKCIDAGCDDYLSKPVVLSKLIETLSKYLENDVLPKDGVSTARHDNDKVNENYLSQMDIPDNEKIIDWAQVTACGLDEQSMKEIIPTYMNDNKEHLRGLITAVKTSNAKDVQSHAHAIKGAGRNLGVARLSELAGQLQTMALKEDLSEAEELLKDITSEFHRLEEFVSKPDWIEMAKEQSTNRLELESNRKSS